MKKLLLLFCLVSTINTKAQDFWTEYATAQPTTSTGVRSISIVNQNVTWLNMACGTSGCQTIRRYAKTTNGGSVWTTGEIDLGPDSNNLEISNICGISATMAYAAVFPKSMTVTGGIWKTIDGGATWTKQPTAQFNSPNYSFTNHVYFWNANEGVAMGDAADGYFEIYTTSNGGELWTRVPSSPVLIPLAENEYGINGNFIVNGDTIWALTLFGRLLKSVDKGLHWTVSQTPFTDGYFTIGINGGSTVDFSFSNSNNGLFQGSDYTLYRTTDGGETFTEVTWTGVLRNFGIAAVPGMSNTYISIGEDLDSTSRGSSYSIDGGVTWFDINNNPDTNFVDGGQIAMLNEDYGFASGFSVTPTEGGIFRWGGGPMLRTAQLAVSTFAGDKSITVDPNPTLGVFNISGENISQIKVYDVMGKQIMNVNYNAVSSANINLDALTNGIYLVNVANDKGTSVIKVVKQ